jgi:hypothetical protein
VSHLVNIQGSEAFNIPISFVFLKKQVLLTSYHKNSLCAYYVYIHPFFPILPPPQPNQVVDKPEVGCRTAADAVFNSPKAPNFEPSSPLSLAISATLALIPHPEDPDPSSAESTVLRREQAQAFAQSAIEGIELELELLSSTTQPSEALSNGPPSLNRKPFCPQYRLENETIVALLLLSGYEYAQRGNIAKMRNRASQALDMALAQGLHARGHEEGPFAEGNRRVWWMTVSLVCLGVSGDTNLATVYMCLSGVYSQ